MVLPCSGSGMIHLKYESPVKSSIEERARGWRRRDLEKKTTSAASGQYKEQDGFGALTFAELTVHLSSQDMEVVGWLGHVGDLHVAVLVLAFKLLCRGEDARLLVAELQIALHAARRMFGTLTVIAVRKRADKTRALKPFDFTRSNELVNDALGVVGKVAELSFPHHKRIRRGQGVAILEAKSTELGER